MNNSDLFIYASYSDQSASVVLKHGLKISLTLKIVTNTARFSLATLPSQFGQFSVSALMRPRPLKSERKHVDITAR